MILHRPYRPARILWRVLLAFSIALVDCIVGRVELDFLELLTRTVDLDRLVLTVLSG